MSGETPETKFDRFDFEQGIMSCWGLIDDMKLLVKREATPEDFDALAQVYQHKFEELFEQFETGTHERKIL